MIPLVVIRPQPGSDASVRAAVALGLDARCFPLFFIRPLAWEPPDPDEVDALLLGSAMVLRHGGEGLKRFSGKPAYVVGETTARAASAAGFKVAGIGKGGLQQVIGQLAPSHRRLLRPCGSDRVQLDLPDGCTLIERLTYASEPQPMPDLLAALLKSGAMVLVHSAMAASHLRHECERLGVPFAKVRLAVLGPRIAEAAGGGWASIDTALQPTDEALLALAKNLCQASAHREAGQEQT